MKKAISQSTAHRHTMPEQGLRKAALCVLRSQLIINVLQNSLFYLVKQALSHNKTGCFASRNSLFCNTLVYRKLNQST